MSRESPNFVSGPLLGWEEMDQSIEAQYQQFTNPGNEPETMPKPELHPYLREMIIADIHTAIKNRGKAQLIDREGNYTTTMSPVTSELATQSAPSKRMAMKLWEHNAAPRGIELAPEVVIYMISYHEVMSFARNTITSHPEPEMSILFRSPHLDVPVFWKKPIGVTGNRDMSLNDTAGLDLRHEMAEAEWFELPELPRELAA